MSGNKSDRQDSFTDLARYEKAKKTLEAIHQATYELIVADGLSAATQEAIAQRANVTQGAVRHYFPTKESLLQAFFMSGLERMRVALEDKIDHPLDEDLAQLRTFVSTHLDSIIATQEVYFFESAAYFARNEAFQIKRQEWYRTLDRYVSRLVRKIRPDWSRKRSEQAAYQILTMVMGGWLTLGSTRVLREKQNTETLKRQIIDGVIKMLEGE